MMMIIIVLMNMLIAMVLTRRLNSLKANFQTTFNPIGTRNTDRIHHVRG
jgi:hypothetical protein